MLLAPFVRHGFGFGVGPDIPVYLWWTRVGASQGLSLVGERPGSPALFAVLAGVTHLPLAAVTAGFEAALGAAIGAGTAMLVRAAGAMAGERRGVRAAWVLAGLLSGLFTVHLAAGYLANLAFAAPFVAAAICLTLGTPRSTVLAAIALGGGGLAHPRFFLIGALVFAGVAAWSLARRERGWRSDAGRVALATLGGGGILAGGLLAMAIGPARLALDTSKDGFLRRAGMADAVRHAYLERALHRWTRYVQWLALPLAALGLMRTSGFARRVLAAWAALVVIGAPIGLLTGWFPADRLITFGFAVPALAGVGVVGVWLWLERRVWVATLVAAALVGVMASGALISWSRQQPFISPLEVESATTAGRIADTLPAGTPLVFIVDDDDATLSFLATRAANVIRASVPPERVADVFIYVGTPQNFLRGEPTVRGSAEYDAMSRLYLSDIPEDPAGGRVRPGTVQPDAGRDDRPRIHPMVGGCGSRPCRDRQRSGPRTIRSNRRRRRRSCSRRSSSWRSPAPSGSGGLDGPGSTHRRRPPSRRRSAWRRSRSSGSRWSRSGYRSRGASARPSSRCSPAGAGTPCSSCRGRPPRHRRHPSRSSQPSSAITNGVIT